MPPGLRITRSHISSKFTVGRAPRHALTSASAIHAKLNPFHTPSARPIQLLLSLVATEGNTTQDRPAPNPKMAASANVNVLVDMLPRDVQRGEVVVGYTDGKVERIAVQAEQQVVGTSKFPKVRRREEEVMSIGKLVEQVDGWARTLKAKDEGVS